MTNQPAPRFIALLTAEDPLTRESESRRAQLMKTAFWIASPTRSAFAKVIDLRARHVPHTPHASR